MTPSTITNTTLSSLRFACGAADPDDDPGADPAAEPDVSSAGRTVTAWIGTATTSGCVSVEIVTCALMPANTRTGGTANETHTGKVVTSFSVPAFFTIASRPLSMTVPSIIWPGNASIWTPADCPG